jgi:uncharacterized protein
MRPPVAEDRQQRRLGLALFLLVMFSLTWLPAAALDPLWPVAADPPATQLLRASVLYAGLMTLQPLFALFVLSRFFGATTVALGARRPRLGWQVIAVVGPLLLAAAAAALAVLLGEANQAAEAARPAAAAQHAATGSSTFFLLFGFAGAVGLLWLQATTEELGWRGYFLPRLMRELGPWTGLVAHGALWGLWYAPLLLVTTGTGVTSLARCAAFVVTCSLLGILLGWIRIAAKSVLVAASANATLTICAALPLFLHGTSAPRTGIFLPVGWVPLGLAVLAILCTRHRRDIRNFVESGAR